MSSSKNYLSNESIENLANEWVLPIEEFPPDPLRSPQQQREMAKKQLVEFLKMEQLLEKIGLGIEALFEFMQMLPPDEMEKAMVELDSLSKFDQIKDLNDPAYVNLAQALGISEETIVTVQRAAWGELRKENWAAAEGIYCLLVLLCPNVARFWFERGIACYYHSNFADAIYSYLKAIEYVDNEEPQMYLYLAHAYFDNGQKNEAKEALQHARQYLSKDKNKWAEWEEMLIKAKIQIK